MRHPYLCQHWAELQQSQCCLAETQGNNPGHLIALFSSHVAKTGPVPGWVSFLFPLLKIHPNPVLPV